MAFAVLAFGAAACVQEDGLGFMLSNSVRISTASIANEGETRVNTLADGTVFEAGDKILLINKNREERNSGTFKFEKEKWDLTDGMVCWSTGDNTFNAYYPATESFTLPAVQNTEAAIKSADRMIATAVVKEGSNVNLSFVRQMAKVTVTATLNSEYSSTDAISLLTINSNDGTVVNPYVSGKTYTAILTPGAYTNGMAFINVTVNGQVMDIPVNSTLTSGLQAGKHYTFSLTVGKGASTICDVSVRPWNEAMLAGGKAEWLNPSDFGVPLITDAAQLSSPFSDSSEGTNIGALIDFDPATFWQTDWHGAVAGDYHWLQIELPEIMEGKMVLWIKRRTAYNDHPSVAVITGSLTSDFGLEIPIDTLELGNASSGQEFTTGTWTIPEPVRYLRFTPIYCSPIFRIYWHSAELNLYKPAI